MDIPALFSSVAATIPLLKTAVAARDEAKIEAAISTLKERLFDLQTANLEAVQQLHVAQTKIHQLVQELDQLRAAKAERGLYVPHNLSQVRGGSFMAYRYEGEECALDGRPIPEHYLCQPCFDSGRKSMLKTDGRGHWRCSVCKAHTYVGPEHPFNGTPID